jgi:hypothetical protein
MSRIFVLFFCFILLGLPGCSDNGSTPGPSGPQFRKSSLEGTWRGVLSVYHVDNGIAAPSYDLQNLNCALILDSEKYWFELSYLSDSLDFAYYNRGDWLWVEQTSEFLYFELTEESSEQTFKSQDSQGDEVVDNRISSKRGDGSQRLESWSCQFDYEEQELIIYNFDSYLFLDEVILKR